ncbi:MAG: hypothetical protein H5T76_30810 [Streptomyces sp.]|nr:hypothetical protein [Streptomyces sp.]
MPTDRVAFRYLDPQGRSELLCRSSGPVLDRLSSDLDGLGVAVFLSDHQGRILSRRAGSVTQRSKLDNACAAEGFDFSERAVGTNAIGTVLEDKSALLVRGGEHYNDLLGPLTCAGAPIRMPGTGRVVGSIALTCPVRATNPLLLTLATNAARQAEQVMTDLDGGRNRALLAALTPRSGPARRAPVVVLTSDAVLANPAGLRFVTPEHHPLLWATVTGRSWDTDPQTIELDLTDGRVLAVAHRITDPVGDAFRLEFRPDVRLGRGAPRRGTDAAESLHPVPAVNEHLRYALDASRTIAIGGAPGTGKFRLSQGIAALGPQHPVTVVDLCAAAERTPRWFADAVQTLSSGGHLVLRHLEDLDAGSVDQVKALTDLAGNTADPRDPAPGRLILTVNLKRTPQHVADLLKQTAITVAIPELYHMKEHIPDVAQAILSGLAGIKAGTTLSSAVRAALMAYPWPGNIRELRLAMADVAAARPGWLIQLEHLPLWLRDAAQGRQLTGYEKAEREAILAALQEADGNRSKAAVLLGIGRTTLYRKIKALHLDCHDQMPLITGG